jgi:hypothetical protein
VRGTIENVLVASVGRGARAVVGVLLLVMGGWMYYENQYPAFPTDLFPDELTNFWEVPLIGGVLALVWASLES